jgi:MFS transporter, CP family, cyanate transporter
VLAGLNLRIAVASVPPVIDEIADDLDLSSAAAGLLTSAPILCFGLLAPVAPLLARRFGAERVLFLALIPLIAGTLVRGGSSIVALFAGTLLAGAAIAVANVVVPSIVKGRFARTEGRLMGLYVAALGGGAALAAGLTVPIQRALEAGWEAGLAVWALPAAGAAAVLGVAVARDDGRLTARGGLGDARALLGDALAWQVTLFFGLQSIVFYIALTWLPSILREDGYGAGEAGALLALFALGGIPASLVVPIMATKMRDQRAIAVDVAAIEAVAIVGLIAAPGAAVLWVFLFALGQGGAFSLALTLIVLRVPDSRRAAELSGMAQAIGYSLAAFGPLAAGALHDWSGGWNTPLVALLLTTVPLLAAGVAAGRARTVPPTRGGQVLHCNTSRVPS